MMVFLSIGDVYWGERLKSIEPSIENQERQCVERPTMAMRGNGVTSS
jgi:hypothetical protein